VTSQQFPHMGEPCKNGQNWWRCRLQADSCESINQVFDGSRLDRSICRHEGWQVGDFGTRVSCANMVEPIEVPFAGWLHGSKQAWIRWGQGRTNLLAAVRGDNSVLRPFIRIISPLVLFHVMLCLLNRSKDKDNIVQRRLKMAENKKREILC